MKKITCIIILITLPSSAYAWNDAIWNVREIMGIVRDVAEIKYDIGRQDVNLMQQQIDVRRDINDLQRDSDAYQERRGNAPPTSFVPPQRAYGKTPSMKGYMPRSGVGYTPNGIAYQKDGCRYFQQIGQVLCPQAP